MPVYEYEHLHTACKLGQVFECEQSINDAQLTVCPQCEKPVKKTKSDLLPMPKRKRGHPIKGEKVSAKSPKR